MKIINPRALDSFCDEMSKISQEQSEKTRLQRMKPGFIGAGLGVLGNLGAGELSFRSFRKEKNLKGSKELLNKVLESSEVPIVRGEALRAFYIPKYPEYLREVATTGDFVTNINGKTLPRGSIVYGPGRDAPSVLAHELGHAELEGTPIQNDIERTAFQFSKPIGGALWGGITSRIRNEKIRRLASLAPILLGAPALIGEGYASKRGLDRLRRLGASPEQLMAARRSLANAFGTYASNALASTGISYLTSEGLAGLPKKNPGSEPISKG